MGLWPHARDGERLRARRKIGLSEGLKSTYKWFLEHYESSDLRV